MHPYAILILIFVMLHLIAVPAFVWTIRKRQLTQTDEAAYRVISGGRTAAPAAPQVAPRRMALFFSVLILFFIGLFAATGYVIYVAQHAHFTTSEDEPSLH